MSKTIKPEDFKVPAQVIEMSAKIRPMLKLGDANGDTQAIVADAGLLAASMEGTELTPEGMAAYNEHLTTLINATSMVAGELAAEGFKANKDVAKAQADVKLVGGMDIGVVINKSRQVPNMDRENPGTKIVYGSTVARVTLVAATTKGAHKKVRAFNAALIEGVCS